MATTTTPLKRARSMASLAGLNPDTLTAADYLEKFGVIVEGMSAQDPNVGDDGWDVNGYEDDEGHGETDTAVRRDRRENREADAAERALELNGYDPAAPVLAEEWEVTPEEQAEFKRIATSGERHEWLERAAEFLRPVLKAAGGELPEVVRVTVSWSYASRKAIGQCWSSDSSGDAVREVTVSPSIDDSVTVIATLAHELCHACLPHEVKHGPRFAKLAKGIGLEGRMTATEAGEAFKQAVAPFIAKWGQYPAKRIDPGSTHKKQTTRMLKCVCTECGYIARVSGMWIERAGPPICPVDNIPMSA